METAQCLRAHGIPCSVYMDADMGGAVKGADLALFGCEAVLPDGSVIGKIGQSAMACLCSRRRIPVYVYAGAQKLLPGAMQCVTNLIREVPAGPEKARVRYFDVTPGEYIDGIITEYGILPPGAAACFACESVSGNLLHFIAA